MKNLMSRLLCVVMCLAALLSMLPGVSAQEATPVEAPTGWTEKLFDMETTATASNVDEALEGWTVSLPAATAIGVEQQLPQPKAVGALPAPQTVAAGPTYTHSEEGALAAAQYMRDQMKARNNLFEFTYMLGSVSNIDTTGMETELKNIYAIFFDAALLHTGDPKEGDYLLWHYAGDGGYGWIEPYTKGGKLYVTFRYSIRYLTSAAQEKQVDTAVNDLLKSLNLGGCTDYQKVKKIYDWMCNNITYDQVGFNKGITVSPLTWTAYKGLTQGTCVCQGYGTIFYRLALECGIDARLVAGNPQAPHGWNIVKLGSYYYNLDSTWDAELHQAGYPYQFFLRSPANFVDHYRYDEYNTIDFHNAYPMSATDYVPGQPVAGDMDGDESLTTDDAVYLLLNVMFGSGDYAIASSVRRDTDGDGRVTTDDAVYLLLHVMFGAVDYPLAA